MKVSRLKWSIYARSNPWTRTLCSHLSRAPAGCFASENHFHGAARPRRLSHGSQARAFIYSMLRRNVSTRKTHRFPIILISGARTDRTRKISSQKRERYFENSSMPRVNSHLERSEGESKDPAELGLR